MAKQLTQGHLQYACREVFENGIPIFRSPYRSPEQLEAAMVNLRTTMLTRGIPEQEHIAVLRVLPGRFTAPDELSWYLGFNDVLLRKDDEIMGNGRKEIITDSDFISRLSSGSLYQVPEEFSTIAASRFLLNSYILLTHPEVMTTYNEVEENRMVCDIWVKKFPNVVGGIEKGVEVMSEEELYGNLGKMNAAEVLENFLGLLSGKPVELPQEIKRDLIKRLPG